MKNLEKAYLRIPLLLNKIDTLIGKLETKYKLTPLQDELLIEFESEFGKLLSSIYGPQFKGTPPVYLTQLKDEYWNDTFETVLSDLVVLFREFENSEKYVVEKFNALTLRANALILYAKKLYGLLVRSEKYFYDAKSRYHWLTDEFCDTTTLSLGSGFLTRPQCEVNIVEGVVTAARKVEQGDSSVPVEAITINPPSNGVPGNSILAFKEKRDNPMNMVDGDPSTWFEYELVRESTDYTEVLNLDITAKLKEQKVINNLILEFVNNDTQDLVIIDEIRTSLDGSTWDYVDRNSVSMIVGAAKNTTGIVSLTTDPRDIRFINIKMHQGTPNKVRTQYGLKNRYFIGLKTLTINSIKFVSESELITTTFEFPEGYNYVSLLTTESPSEYSSAYRYEYFISPDEANHWYQVTPSNYNYSISGSTKLLEFNTEGKDSIRLSATPTSLLMRMRVVRDDKMFTAGYVASDNDKVVETEYTTSQGLEEFKNLREHALKETVLVERTSLGSVGSGGKYLVGIATSALDQEFPIPIDIRDKSVSLYVSGSEWKRVASLTNSQPTDKHYTVNIYTNRIKFGNGTTGAIPAGKIEVGITEDIIGFTPDHPHVGELSFYCDGNKESVTLYTTTPYQYINQHRLGRGMKQMTLNYKGLYAYDRVCESLPLGTTVFTLRQPAFVTPDILFEDKEVFATEVESIDKVLNDGDYYIDFNEITRLVSVTTKKRTHGKSPGNVYYNARGRLSPRKLTNTQPFDKLPYYTTNVDGVSGLASNSIRVSYLPIFSTNAIIRLWAVDGSTQYNKIISGLKNGDWCIVALSSELESGFANGNVAGYYVQVLEPKTMAPSFSNTDVFSRERPYQDGSNELEKHGDYSIHYAEGEVFSFTQTSTKSDDTMSFYHSGMTEVSKANWEFVDDEYKPLFKKLIIDDATYRETPETISYAVDAENYAYIKPGKGCNDFDYTKIKYTDDFLKDPSSPRFVICGSTARDAGNDYSYDPNTPTGKVSNIDWPHLELPSDPDITTTISINKNSFTKGQTILVDVGFANDTSSYINTDVYIDLQFGNKLVHLYSVSNMYVPPDFFVNSVRIVEYLLSQNYTQGVYTIWFGMFAAGTSTLVGNLSTATFEFKNESSRGESEYEMSFGNTDVFKTTFIPYYDLVRGKYLPEGSRVVDLGYKNIIGPTIKYICVDSTAICVFSVDIDGLTNDSASIHMCKKGFRPRNMEEGSTMKATNKYGRYYYEYCTNTECPMYLTHRKQREAMFSAEVGFINGAEEFKNAATELHSVDTTRGYLYTSFNIPAGMIASFKAGTHKAEYTIVKPLPAKDYIVKENSVKLVNRELIDVPTTKLAIKYRRRKSLPEVVSKLREYFTPIIKSYKIRVGKRFDS